MENLNMTPIGCRQKCFLTLVSLTLKNHFPRIDESYVVNLPLVCRSIYSWIRNGIFFYFGLMPIIIFAYCHGISEMWCLAYVLMSYPHSRLILIFCINYSNAYLLSFSINFLLNKLFKLCDWKEIKKRRQTKSGKARVICKQIPLCYIHYNILVSYCLILFAVI